MTIAEKLTLDEKKDQSARKKEDTYRKERAARQARIQRAIERIEDDKKLMNIPVRQKKDYRSIFRNPPKSHQKASQQLEKLPSVDNLNLDDDYHSIAD